MSPLSKYEPEAFFLIGGLSADRLLSEGTPMPNRFFSAISHNTTRINHQVSASDRLRSDALQLQRNCILGHRRLNGLATT
jgi:hypothetical protein